MTKAEYLTNKDVVSFVYWIRDRIEKNGKFTHEYINNQLEEVWKCDGIFDASKKYVVNGFDFETTQSGLEKLKNKIKQSIENNNSEACRKACKDILLWGGVAPKNKDKITELDKKDVLISYLLSVKEFVCKNKYDIKELPQELISNAGFTKIYSLLCNNFIIYDSRVAATLCYFIRVFLSETHIDGSKLIPDVLNFKIMSNKGNNQRNPSGNGYKFEYTNNDQQKHFESNIKANWLFSMILEDETEFSKNYSDFSTQLKALENAFFMIGYSLPSP